MAFNTAYELFESTINFVPFIISTLNLINKQQDLVLK